MTMDGRVVDTATSGPRVGNLTSRWHTVTSNTSTLSVEDNIIELNRNISKRGMPNYTGLKVNRGETSSATEQDLLLGVGRDFRR
jgi:hypothetical protein